MNDDDDHNNSNDHLEEENWKDDDFLSFDPPEGERSQDTYGAPENDNSMNNSYQGRSSQGHDALSNGTSSISPQQNELPPWMSVPMRRLETNTIDGFGGPGYDHLRQSSSFSHQSVPINPLVQLHNEIVDFVTLMEPRQEELRARDELVEQLRVVARSVFGPDCPVDVFGSQATGLLLPSSDIDIVITIPESEFNDSTNESRIEKGGESSKEKTKNNEKDQQHQATSVSVKEQERREMDDWDSARAVASASSPLQRLAAALRSQWGDEKLAYLEVIENTRVPLVKLSTRVAITCNGEGVKSEPEEIELDLAIDISFNQVNASRAAALMKTYLQAMPPLRHLTFVLKYFLVSRGMNEPYTGGMGSFMLQLMIVSFLQHRERDGYNYRRPSLYNLGCLLVEFLELYGIDFNYLTTGISVRHDGFYFAKGARDKQDVFYNSLRPFSMAVENPLDLTMDVGKGSFRMQTIQRSFETAFKLLLAHVSEPSVPCVSILGSILPVTDEMRARQKTVAPPLHQHERETSSSGFSYPARPPSNQALNRALSSERSRDPKRRRYY